MVDEASSSTDTEKAITGILDISAKVDESMNGRYERQADYKRG
jgi:hypothetical protein